jgi:ArsR family transcriptional regulator
MFLKAKSKNSFQSNTDFTPEIKVQLFEKQSEFCKTFTNPTRLQIISVLIEEIFEDGCIKKVLKELNVTDILSQIKSNFNVELSQTTLSQHISILKQHKVLIARRDGNNIFYKVANHKIIDACCLVREIVIDLLKNTLSFSDNLSEF